MFFQTSYNKPAFGKSIRYDVVYIFLYAFTPFRQTDKLISNLCFRDYINNVFSYNEHRCRIYTLY